jgi:Tfp pilus assembly protein PilF
MSGHADTLLAAIDHQRAARLPQAEALYRSVLDAEPDNAHALYLFGLLHLGAGRPGAALPYLGRAARARPFHQPSWIALARARLGASDAAGTLAAADTALALGSGAAEAHFLRGTALDALGSDHAALAALSRAIDLDPGQAAAHLNRANALADLDRLAEAETCCREALRLDPALVEAHASLGFLLTGLGRLTEAVAACEAAIALAPNFAHAHWNLATAALLDGDFARGFREYEWRKRHDDFRRDFLDLPGPIWNGGDCAGRRVLVMAEQGLGDTIQLARFLPRLAARGGIVHLACDPCLIPLLGRMPGVTRTVPRHGRLPEYDLWIDQMSLPRAFAATQATLPGADGYLKADAGRAAAWGFRLPPGRRIGVAWAGNPGHSNDRRRSLPFAMLARLIGAAPDIRFVSLQRGPRAAEAELLGMANHEAALTDYAETAALVAQLDLVIAVDTSVAHLAGAMGKPVWAMLPYAPDWRWILGRDDTPWYSSMRLFRQDAPGDWDGVIDRVVAVLAGGG